MALKKSDFESEEVISVGVTGKKAARIAMFQLIISVQPGCRCSQILQRSMFLTINTVSMAYWDVIVKALF